MVDKGSAMMLEPDIFCKGAKDSVPKGKGDFSGVGDRCYLVGVYFPDEVDEVRR